MTMQATDKTQDFFLGVKKPLRMVTFVVLDKNTYTQYAVTYV